MDMDRANRDTYERADTVRIYAGDEAIQPAERAILEILGERLPGMAMLDVGIGGGRTTRLMASLVHRYVGIDYSEQMIAACRQRFPESDHLTLMCADVRSMGQFAGGTFDLVFFSYNGLDYMSHVDRLKTLGEIRRVGKPGSVFAFSSHNILNVERFLQPGLSLHLIHWFRCQRRACEVGQLIRLHGGVERMSYGIIRDGAENFRLHTYYIHPLEQIKQLETAGFGDIRVFAEATGEEVADRARLTGMRKERWFYFLCTRTDAADTGTTR